MAQFLSYGQLVIGPAGSGKSTYCKIIKSHCLSTNRTVRIVNMDPAAEKNEYECDIDVKELISVDSIMKKKKLGPNGALIYCMEYIISNFSWIEEKITSFGENQYFLFDCPGQLELYAHYPVMKQLTKMLKDNGMNIISIFCLDCTFAIEYSKFISGSSLALACMVQLELPHINVLTKADLVKNSDLLENLREVDLKSTLFKEEIESTKNSKFLNLNKALVDLLENYSLVNLIPLNINDEESIEEVLYNADLTLQYLDNQEPKEDFYEQPDQEEDYS